MQIQLVSHASVLIKTADAQIWTDPWLVSKVFNDSWTMHPPPAFDEAVCRDTDYLWISHEHPDHFNVPTLKALPAEFKERVTVLFQKKNTAKIFDALRQFGFRHFRELPNRQTVALTEGTSVYCYQVGVMDSILAVTGGGRTVLNVNDAKINKKDCRLILSDIKRVDVHLNQFSLAGYNGYVNYRERLPGYAREDIVNLVANHNDLGAKVTIPFASFVYFSCTDNKYVNEFANKPADVCQSFGDECVILYPGDTYDTEQPYDSRPALHRFAEAYRALDQLEYDEPKRIEMAEIKAAFDKLAAQLHQRFPRMLLALLRPVTVRIPDLDAAAVRFSVASGAFEEVPDVTAETDLIVNSQPLHFAFKFPYGFQTLGVSARFFITRNFSNWRRHRILFSLNNAELYLRPGYFLRPDNLKYVVRRLAGGPNQLVARLQRMK
ncbi:MAG: MBL fold metallo-hydrolase [Pyrinomonadaceae bacterium]